MDFKKPNAPKLLKKRPRGKKKFSFYGNFFWAIVTLLAVSIIFSYALDNADEPEELSVNELANRVVAGEVAEIKINGDAIEAFLKDGGRAESKKEREASITETFVNLGVSKEALAEVRIEVVEESGLRFWMGILIPTLLPLLILIAVIWFFFRRAQGGVNQAFNFGKSNLKISAQGKEKTTFDDVAGLKESKEELVEIVDFLKNPKKYLAIGATIPRGVLLVGLPGTGKTLLARAVAGEAKVPFFHISASEFVEMFVGVGASRTRDAFATAKKSAPSILFIDEIDAVGRQRGAGLGGGNDEREQTLNQILVELDGFERDARVIVLAATNRPDVLDPALLRPGRFDRRVILDMPDIKAREDILKIHSKNKKIKKGFDYKKIAVRTPGFSGADLANLMNEGALLAARKNRKEVEQQDVYDSIEKVIMGPERKSRVVAEHERDITAYHEAGHALVADVLKDSDPVHKVTIVSRGMAAGYTMKLPTEDRRLRTKNQFLAELAVSMGGLVAEKITFKETSTGASNDLKVASEIARKLVTKYGMSDKLGPITYGSTEEMVFLGREIAHEKNYSEDTAKKIDHEVKWFMDKAYKTAHSILTKNNKALKAIANELLKKETLEQEEFDKLLKPFKLKSLGV